MMEVSDIVMKLIGPVTAVGDTRVDEIRLENLKVLIGVAEILIGEIAGAAQVANRPEDSMRRIGKCATEFLDDTQEILENREE